MEDVCWFTKLRNYLPSPFIHTQPNGPVLRAFGIDIPPNTLPQKAQEWCKHHATAGPLGIATTKQQQFHRPATGMSWAGRGRAGGISWWGGGDIKERGWITAAMSQNSNPSFPVHLALSPPLDSCHQQSWLGSKDTHMQQAYQEVSKKYHWLAVWRSPPPQHAAHALLVQLHAVMRWGLGLCYKLHLILLIKHGMSLQHISQPGPLHGFHISHVSRSLFPPTFAQLRMCALCFFVHGDFSPFELWVSPPAVFPSLSLLINVTYPFPKLLLWREFLYNPFFSNWMVPREACLINIL